MTEFEEIEVEAPPVFSYEDFDMFLDVEIGSFRSSQLEWEGPVFDASEVIKNVDPIMYQEMYNKWVDMQISEAQNELIIEEEEPEDNFFPY